MISNGQVKGIITFLTKLTHTVDSFRFKFVNVSVEKVTKIGLLVPLIKYDLEITSKEQDIPYLWDFFNCKSKHITQDGCEMISADWAHVYTELGKVYYDGEEIRRYGGEIPDLFTDTVDIQIQQMSPKQIKSHFFCGGKRKELILNVTYKVSDIYIDDGITTDVSVYCHQALVDDEPLENIPQDLVETIVGFMSEDDNLRVPLDEIVWNEITKYMNLEDCELWTHTYTYLRNIGNVEVSDFNYVNQSTFSSKMCDFISGDY
tara:strand:+ start:658 stop:1440 length:783 start_codon:yes stop_codon:yes gene_type:complete